MRYLGEMDQFNNPHGRGIKIFSIADIHIGYFNNDKLAPGKYINIYSDGEFEVGEMYLKDGVLDSKSTFY